MVCIDVVDTVLFDILFYYRLQLWQKVLEILGLILLLSSQLLTPSSMSFKVDDGDEINDNITDGYFSFPLENNLYDYGCVYEGR